MPTCLSAIKATAITVLCLQTQSGCSSHSFQSECFDGLPGCPCFEDRTCYDDVACLDDGICADSNISPDTGAGCAEDESCESSDTGDIPTDPTIGAFESGTYRNLFSEIGKSESEIRTKIDTAWEQIFYGDANHRLYYPEDDKAYILDVGNQEVRSEGMGFGMMIAVQLDKQEEFDKLWNWVQTYKYYDTGPYAGFFGWQNTPDGERVDGTRVLASDGEEFMAMALFFASHRWGDGEGIYNYGKEANGILHAMLHQADDGVGINMFDDDADIVVYCPSETSANFTSVSYIVPGFYQLFAKWADEDKERWQQIADTGRQFFHLSTNPDTGLNPDYALFDGTPYDPEDGNHVNFTYDAWKTAVNISFDYAWFMADPWQVTYAETIQAFFYSEGVASYGDLYQLDGTFIEGSHSSGLVACNAVPGLVAHSEKAREFTEALWALQPPLGVWRYYNGVLYFMSLLHAAGEFRIW